MAAEAAGHRSTAGTGPGPGPLLGIDPPAVRSALQVARVNAGEHLRRIRIEQA